MQSIEAIYQNGVFKPMENVDLPDNQRVRLQVQPCPGPIPSDVQAWLDELKRVRESLAAKYGQFDDSTLLIAEDRRRDV